MHFAARFAGYSYAEFAGNYKVLVDANIRAMEHFDTDLVGLISDPYRETSAFGATVTFPKEAVPVCKELLVRDIDDVKTLKNPDVYKAERTLDRIRGAEHFQKRLRGTVPVIGWIEGPLAEACDLAGMGQMMMQLMTAPDFSHLLLDKCVVTARDFASAQIEAGCDIIGMGDAVCSQIDLISYETYVKDRHREIIDHIHALGALVKLHICGDISHLLPAIADLHVDILDIDWQVDLQHAHSVVGYDTVLCGNLDPVFVESKTPEEIGEAVAGLLSKEEGKRHILSAGCEITVNTPAENLMAMRKASKKY
jgi:MtaA/CmuA family methyltransferase